MIRTVLKYAISIVFFIIFSCSEKGADKSDITDIDANVVDLVNPLMGTDSDFSLSNGNTYPAIATPWAMNFWTPMTSKMVDGWTYKYDATKIRGIKQTHQPSPWINDYAAFSLMAVSGNLKYKENEPYSLSKEIKTTY